MSKVFKSRQYQEALPCRLEPVDVDIFFINEPEATPEIPPESVVSEPEQSELEKNLQLMRDQAETDLKLAQQEAAEILSQARSQAEELVAQALAEARREGAKLAEEARQEGRKAGWQEGHQEGYREGRQTGWQEGHQEARQELAADLATALSLIEQGETEKQARIMESEPEIIKLALAIAEKIIAAELEISPEQRLAIARAALQRVVTANSILIRVSPEDQALLEGNLQYLQEIFNAPKTFQIQPDPALSEGNFFIETEVGTVDPRIKQQLERIAAEIAKAGTLP